MAVDRGRGAWNGSRFPSEGSSFPGKRGVGIVMSLHRVLCRETKAGHGNGRESVGEHRSKLIISDEEMWRTAVQKSSSFNWCQKVNSFQLVLTLV